jgi:hypothetical protein
MGDHVIEIAEQPNGRLEPKKGRVTRVKSGDSVTITHETGATDLKIEFKGRSPFKGPVKYKEPMKIDVAFVAAGGAKPNTFEYSCSFKKAGRPLSTEGGGVIVIESGDD